MSEILNESKQSKIERSSEESGNDNSEWLNDNSETGAEKRLDADAVIKEEKTWMETMRGKAKEIAALLLAATISSVAFNTSKATAEEIQAFVSQDKDSDKIEMVQKSESEINQAVEAKIQEYLSSIPENVTDRQISVKKDGVGDSAINVAPSGENVFIANRYYSIDYANPQSPDNVIKVEKKSGEVSIFGHIKNIEADGDIFTADGYGATREEALATALEEAARYIGTGVALNSEKNTHEENKNHLTSLVSKSERSAAHYIKSYKEIPGETVVEERPDGEKFYTVQIEVQPGKLAGTSQ